MENSPNWCIKPSFIDGLSISYQKGYFADDSISDGLTYYNPIVTFKYVLDTSEFNYNIPLIEDEGYYSHPAYEYTKFIIDTVINTDNRYHYELQCELSLMTDIPMESWIMDRECTEFKFYPEEYDLDSTAAFYCTVSVIFHNVIGTKLLLSNLFMRKFKNILDNNTINEDYYEHSNRIFGGRYGGRYHSNGRITMDVITPNASILHGSSLKALETYIPWMMPDETDKILANIYSGPIVKLMGYINRNISMFVRYEVTINDIPPIDGLTVKEVKLILNKLLEHKRTRRIVDDSGKRKNIERYTYSPNFSPNLYVVIMNESSVSDILKFVSSQRGLKRLSFGSV